MTLNASQASAALAMTSIRLHLIGDQSGEPSPEPILDQLLASVPAAELHDSLLIVDYPYAQYWLEGQPSIRLLALFSFYMARELTLSFTVTPATSELGQTCRRAKSLQRSAFEALCQQYQQPLFSPSQAAGLIPVAIPKPWGKEIWYTGIETRGVTAVGYDDCQIPLPHWLSALPGRLAGSRRGPPLLLKVLDPLSQAVLGDLYWELHREKREVYVITAIDPEAWPGGQGSIRFGLNQQKRSEYSSDADFREAYLQSVQAYEQVRRDIDMMLDCQGVETADRSAAVHNRLVDPLAALPASIGEQELRLRVAMESFTHTQSLAVGDVVKVPCLMPHSLQHGVRTIEFQTPVYERMIVSFAQKVLTQPHWDTAQAVALMDLEPAPPEPNTVIVNLSGCVVERIVDFEDFEVQRISLAAGGQFILSAPSDYAVLIVIQGDVVIGGVRLAAEAAVMLPSSISEQHLINSGTDTIVFLLAFPK